MALSPKSIDIPFEAGLSQKIDQQWLDTGASSTAQNLVRSKARALVKRKGLVSLSKLAVTPSPTGTSSDTLTAGRRVLSFRGQPLIAAKDQWTDALSIFNEQAGAPLIIDRLPEVYVQPYDFVASSEYGTAIADVAITNGYEIFVWADPAGSNGTFGMAIRMAATGATVLRPQLVQSGVSVPVTQIKVCAPNSTSFLVTYASGGADNNIYATVINTANIGTGSSIFAFNGTRINNANGDAQSATAYDVAPVIGDGTRFVLWYKSTTATHQVLILYTLSTLVAVSTTNVDDGVWVAAASPTPTAAAIRADSNASEVCYAMAWKAGGNNQLTTAILNYPAMTVKAAAVDLWTATFGSMSKTNDNAATLVTVERNSGSGRYTIRSSPGLAQFDQATPQLPYIASWQAGTSGGAMTIAANQPRATWGIQIFSRDYVANGISYLMGYVPSGTQGSSFLLADDAWNDISSTPGTGYPLRLVANIVPRLQNPVNETSGGLVTSLIVPIHLVTNPNAAGGLVVETSIPVATSALIASPARLLMDFSSALPHQSAELGANALVACGSPSGTDGASVFELAFPIYPAIVSVTMAGAGGSLSAGSYNYIAIFEWTDAFGQKHRSGRSVAFTKTAVNNDKATVVIAICGFSAKIKAQSQTNQLSLANSPQGGLPAIPGPIAVKLYRTQVNGTVYTSVNVNDNALTFVSLSANTVTIVDSAADAAILSHPLLMGDGSDGKTPGNILDNLCVPSSQAMCVHQNRAFFVDGKNIYPTKAFTFGEGCGVHENTAFSVDDGPGPVTAVASMDEKLVIFKSDRILYMTGQGPDDSGGQNDWQPPQRIASDYGAIDWRSVVSTPRGIYFMSAVGRRLLTRDLQVTSITNVEDVDAQYPVVTSAILHPTASRIVWTQCTDDVTSPRAGAIVNYDYNLDTWTTWVFNDNSGHATLGFVSSAFANVQTVAGPPPVNKPGLYLMRDDGTPMREDIISGASFDTAVAAGGNIFVPMTWTSPWIKAEGLVGWANWTFLRILMRANDPANITVTIDYNYPNSPLASQVATFPAPQTTTFPGLFEVRIKENRAAAIRVTIADASGTGTVNGAGFVLVGMRLDYEVDTGGYRAPSGQRG